MRRSLLLTTALSEITCILSAGPFSPVSLGIGPEEYFGTTYTNPPIRSTRSCSTRARRSV